MPTLNKTGSLGNFTTGLKKNRYDTQRTKGSDSTRISISGSRTGIPMHPKMVKNSSKIGSGVLSHQQTPNLLSSSSIGQKYHSQNKLAPSKEQQKIQKFDFTDYENDEQLRIPKPSSRSGEQGSETPVIMKFEQVDQI